MKGDPKAKDGVRMHLKLDFQGSEGKNPDVQAYLFSASGALVSTAPVDQAETALIVPPSLDGHKLRLVIGARPAQGAAALSLGELRRLGAWERDVRFLVNNPKLDVIIRRIDWERLFFCSCVVRGRLIKRVTLPDGTTATMPVCNARVTICEVDSFPSLIGRLPDRDIFRLRDDLLDLLRRHPIPRPPFPPEPWPGPFPIDPIGPVALNPQPLPPRPIGAGRMINPGLIAGFDPQPDPPAQILSTKARRALAVAQAASAQADTALMAASLQSQMFALTSSSVHSLRLSLIDLAPLIRHFICHWHWLHRYYTKDCIRTVEVDSEGRFETTIYYPCHGDKPDLYFSVEQLQNGSWVKVYEPSVACNTYWDYDCGSEVVINVPAAIGCFDPPVEIPPGVTLFVLPHRIGHTRIWGTPAGSPPAPVGWVRSDGFTDYSWGGWGVVRGAPFGGTLTFFQDDSYFIPTDTIKYYRYSFRRVGASGWTPMMTAPLFRQYREEYNDGTLPTYDYYQVGPNSVNDEHYLYEFKPQTPPSKPGDPAALIVREWTSTPLTEAAAYWDTTTAAPGVAHDALTDNAGDFEIKIEVFDKNGSLVTPGPSTFQFLALNADAVTTRLAQPGELLGGAFVFRVHVDNNPTFGDVLDPTIGGVGPNPNCGFLNYDPTSTTPVQISFRAQHRHGHAVWAFNIERGDFPVAGTGISPSPDASGNASPTVTTSPAGPYVLGLDGIYRHGFNRGELLGPCTDAAFAASVYVYGTATDGYTRLGYEHGDIYAFALAEAETSVP